MATIDVHLEHTHNDLVKDHICSNLAVVMELLYLELFLAKERIGVRVVTKLLVYVGIGRGIWLLTLSSPNLQRLSLEFVYSVIFDCMLGLVMLKDAVVFGTFLKTKWE